MDDELSQLEAELKSLRPTAPSPELLARLGRELEPQQRRRRDYTRWFWAAALPVAAAVAIMIRFSAVRDTGDQLAVPVPIAAADASTSAPFQPVAAENVLYAAEDEGLVTLSDGTPAHRERLNYLDTITWKNPRTNASVRWSMPREEVRVVPVNFQ